MNEDFDWSQIRILVVDDYAPKQNLIKAYLKSFGCQGDYATSGQEAIEKIQQTEYDLCLMDIQMPVQDGIQTTQIIRSELKKDFPILALSADGEPEDQERAYAAGIQEYVTKPLRVKDLREKVLKYLDPKKDSEDPQNGELNGIVND